MKKKVLSAILASMMTISMLGTQVFAAGGELTDPDGTTGTIEGESGLKEPIYNVVVPTDLVFSVDAFEQGERSQIYSVDFPIVNRSNLNVKVSVSLKVVDNTTAQDITFLADPADVTKDGTNKDKEVYIAAAVPATVTSTLGTDVNQMVGTDTLYKVTSDQDATGIIIKAAGDAAAITLAQTINATMYAAGENPVATAVLTKPVMAEGTFAYTGTKNFVEVPLSDENTTIYFALAKAAYGTEYYSDADTKAKAYSAMAASDEGVTSYRFYGIVNDSAKWAEKDLKATAKYDFIGLSDSVYADYLATNIEIGETGTFAHGLVEDISAVKPVQPTQGVLNYSSATFWAAINATNGGIADASKLKDVKISRDGGTAVAVTATDYTVTANGWMTIKWDKAATLLSCTWVADTPFTITYTYDGVAYTATVVPK